MTFCLSIQHIITNHSSFVDQIIYHDSYISITQYIYNLQISTNSNKNSNHIIPFKSYHTILIISYHSYHIIPFISYHSIQIISYHLKYSSQTYLILLNSIISFILFITFDLKDVIAHVPPHWRDNVIEDAGSRWAGQVDIIVPSSPPLLLLLSAASYHYHH